VDSGHIEDKRDWKWCQNGVKSAVGFLEASFLVHIRAMATAFVFINVAHNAGIYRIAVDITGHSKKVFLCINQDGLVSPPK